jgi:hypothetical protein
LAWYVYCFSAPPRRLCFWVNKGSGDGGGGGGDNSGERCICFPKLVPRNPVRIHALYSLTPRDLDGLAVGMLSSISYAGGGGWIAAN